MNAVSIVIGSTCILMIAYRLYGTFMAAKVLKLNDAQPTPAHELVVLFASMRKQGKSLSEVAKEELGPVAGFGAVLVECLVGIMALIAATALQPADYFAINSSPAVFETLGMTYIFTKIPWFSHLASYFFQFVIMFEAVFILTAIDAGTRVSRYLIQDFSGDLYKPLKRTDWLPDTIFASLLACFLWGYLLYPGDIGSVWALFGVSNQLMASIGLIIGATVILKIADKRWYVYTCLVPLAFSSLQLTIQVTGK